MIFIVAFTKIEAQNLVPNPSFEQFSNCPQGSFSITDYAIDWIDPTNASSELLDTCEHTPYIDFNNWPYIYPRSGGAMAGVFIKNNGGSCPVGTYSNTYREYIEVKLTDSLQNNQLYYMEFYVAPSPYMMFGTHNISAAITDTLLPGGSGGSSIVYSSVQPQITPFANTCITDTSHWSRINGFLYGTGYEKYLTIGNFKVEDSLTLSVINPNGYCGVYYFVDDVSLYEVTHWDAWDAGPDKIINYGDSVQIGNPCSDYSMFNWVTSLNSITHLSDSTMPQIWSKPPVTTTYYVTKTQGSTIFQDTVTVTILGGTGIGEIKNNSKIKIYPNPTNSIIKISGINPHEEIKIYDVLGNEILKSMQKEIDVSSLPSGMYYLKIGNGTQKFVKQ